MDSDDSDVGSSDTTLEEPYSETSEYSIRSEEVWGKLADAGLTRVATIIALGKSSFAVMQELWQRRRNPEHVSSRFIILAAWRLCLGIRCPDAQLSFPLLEDIVSENTRGDLGSRPSSTTYRTHYNDMMEWERQGESYSDLFGSVDYRRAIANDGDN